MHANVTLDFGTLFETFYAFHFYIKLSILFVSTLNDPKFKKLIINTLAYKKVYKKYYSKISICCSFLSALNLKQK